MTVAVAVRHNGQTEARKPIWKLLAQGLEVAASKRVVHRAAAAAREAGHILHESHHRHIVPPQHAHASHDVLSLIHI